MEAWQNVWRNGFGPLMTVAELQAGLDGLRNGDPCMIQGATTDPPPAVDRAPEIPCKAACFVGYCAWKGDTAATVGDIEERFARLCFETDQRLGEPAGCRWFLNWFDETPIEDVRRELAIEVGKSLLERGIAV